MTRTAATKTATMAALPLLRSAATVATLATGLLLSGCGAIKLKTEPNLSARTVSAPAAAPVASTARPAMAATGVDGKAAQGTAAAPASTAEGLRLARLLRDQGRLEGAAGVYAQLDDRGALKPLELLEYASVAAAVQPAQDSLALFGRARRALAKDTSSLSPGARVTLCNGLGRARLTLGQTDAALADFNCTLEADADNVIALNAKGILLDARGDHAEARRVLTQASEIDPADFRIVNNLALSYLASGDNRQAIRLLTQADGRRWPALKLNLAFAYTLQQQDAKARETLQTFMSAALVDQTMQAFTSRRQRIARGAAVTEELMAASHQLLALREGNANE